MGKRELLLVLGLIAAGAVTYSLTAPPSAPGGSSFSLSRTIEEVRRHIRGNRASAETTVTAAHQLSPSTSEITLALTTLAESLTITGEDRTDVASELHVWSNGYDEPEAKRLAGETVLKATEGGGRMNFTIAYPHTGRQRVNLTLRVPSRMRVSVPRFAGKLNVSRTAEVQLLDARENITIREVPGRVEVNQRGGELTLADTGAATVKLRGVDATLSRVAGDLSIQSDGGEVTGSEIAGGLEINARAGDVSLDKLGKMTGPIHAMANEGTLRLIDVATETRVDARETEVTVALLRPTALTVSNEGGGTIEVTPAAGGLAIDVLTTGSGTITAPEGYPSVETQGTGQRLAGAISGGGPAITLRAADGDIVIRTAGSAPAPRPARRERNPGPPKPPRPPAPPRLEER
jgi:hypothetical protein